MIFRLKRRCLAHVLVCILTCSGLAGGTGATRADEPAKQNSAGKSATTQIELASFAQIQEAVAKYRGKVVLVDYWSSWCPPCVKELPEFVQLRKELVDKNLGDKVVFLTVDCDFAGGEQEKPEQHRENVLGILAKNHVTTRNFLCTDPDLTVFDKLQVGSVPVLHVFDKSGKLHKRFDNENEAFGDEGFSILKHVKPVVLELLK